MRNGKPPPARHAPAESRGDPPGPKNPPTLPSHPHQESIHQLHPPILQPHSPSTLVPPTHRPRLADLTGSQTMLPLPHVRPVPPHRSHQTFNQPRVHMHSRTDINVVGVLLAIQGHEPGNKGNRKVRDTRGIRTATHLADGAGKEVVDATVPKVEQHVHGLEGTLRPREAIGIKVVGKEDWRGRVAHSRRGRKVHGRKGFRHICSVDRW